MVLVHGQSWKFAVSAAALEGIVKGYQGLDECEYVPIQFPNMYPVEGVPVRVNVAPPV